MIAIPPHEPLPLKPNADGVILVGNTRVPLDTVVGAFDEGMTPEEIVRQYTSLDLADVYSVIAYYLRHHDEVAAYLQERQHHAEQVRLENEARFDPAGVRERLLARRSNKG
jgi:uncharacterized protein (DUF433 family)